MPPAAPVRDRLVAARSDADLVTAATGGDVTAFEELYRRHVSAAWRVAQAVAGNAHDAADAVSDAFTRVFEALQRHRLDDGAGFRSYLLTATRNAAIDVHRRGKRTSATDDPVVLEGSPQGSLGAGGAAVAATPADRAELAADAALVAEAFHNLPERWRSVLWLTEVEGMPAREAASTLGLSANGVAQLAVRARAGLRERYLQAHLRNGVPDGCSFTVDRLGAYVGGGLSRRDTDKVDAHLATCEECRRRREELEEVGSSLRRIVLPLPVFLGGATLARFQSALAAGSVGGAGAGSATGGLSSLLDNRVVTRALAGATAGVLGLGMVAAVMVTGERGSEGSTPLATAPAEEQEETDEVVRFERAGEVQLPPEPPVAPPAAGPSPAADTDDAGDDGTTEPDAAPAPAPTVRARPTTPTEDPLPDPGLDDGERGDSSEGDGGDTGSSDGAGDDGTGDDGDDGTTEPTVRAGVGGTLDGNSAGATVSVDDDGPTGGAEAGDTVVGDEPAAPEDDGVVVDVGGDAVPDQSVGLP